MLFEELLRLTEFLSRFPPFQRVGGHPGKSAPHLRKSETCASPYFHEPLVPGSGFCLFGDNPFPFQLSLFIPVPLLPVPLLPVPLLPVPPPRFPAGPSPSSLWHYGSPNRDSLRN